MINRQTLLCCLGHCTQGCGAIADCTLLNISSRFTLCLLQSSSLHARQTPHTRSAGPHAHDFRLMRRAFDSWSRYAEAQLQEVSALAAVEAATSYYSSRLTVKAWRAWRVYLSQVCACGVCILCDVAEQMEAETTGGLGRIKTHIQCVVSLDTFHMSLHTYICKHPNQRVRAGPCCPAALQQCPCECLPARLAPAHAAAAAGSTQPSQRAAAPADTHRRLVRQRAAVAAGCGGQQGFWGLEAAGDQGRAALQVQTEWLLWWWLCICVGTVACVSSAATTPPTAAHLNPPCCHTTATLISGCGCWRQHSPAGSLPQRTHSSLWRRSSSTGSGRACCSTACCCGAASCCCSSSSGRRQRTQRPGTQQG